MLSKNVKKALLIGSAHSNNILGLSQILIENGIAPRALMLRLKSPLDQGNFRLSKMLLRGIEWIERDEWPRALEIAQKMAQDGEMIIPEGADMPEAFAGAQTLAEDIKRNEERLGLKFAHIFLDAGTGLAARAAILGLRGENRHFHVVKASPYAKLPKGDDISHYKPSICPSFGSSNRQLLSFMRDFTYKEGIFLDPLYTGKLFFEAKRLSPILKGPVLIVHSGNSLSFVNN